MAESLAANYIENITDVMLAVANTVTQDNQTVATATTNIVVKDNTGVVVTIVSGSQYVSTDVTGVQDSYYEGQVDTDIQNITDAVAQAYTEAGFFSKGGAESLNDIANVVNLSYAVYTAYFQNCVSTVTLEQSLYIEGNEGLVYTEFNGDQIIESSSNCTQNNTTVSAITTQIINDTKASASSTVQSNLWSIIILCSLIIIICGLIIFISYSSLLKLILFVVVFVAIGFGIWILSAWLLGAPPFEPENPNDSVPVPPYLPEHDNTKPVDSDRPPEYSITLPPGSGQPTGINEYPLASFTLDQSGEVAFTFNIRSWRNPRQTVTMFYRNADSTTNQFRRTFYVSQLPMLRSFGTAILAEGTWTLWIENVGLDYLFVGDALRQRVIPPDIMVGLATNVTEYVDAFEVTLSIESGSGLSKATASFVDPSTGEEIGKEQVFQPTTTPTAFVIKGLNLDTLNLERKNDDLPPVASYNIRLQNTGERTLLMQQG